MKLEHERVTTSGIRQWISYQIRKIAGCACAGNAGNLFPTANFQGNRLVSHPGMHHGTCVTHVPWCMSGSLTYGNGENVSNIRPAHAQTAILRIWQEAHGYDYLSMSRFVFTCLSEMGPAGYLLLHWMYSWTHHCRIGRWSYSCQLQNLLQTRPWRLALVPAALLPRRKGMVVMGHESSGHWWLLYRYCVL